MKSLFKIIGCLLFLVSLSSSIVAQENILELYEEEFFEETLHLKKGKLRTLNFSVLYNHPKYIDEEFIHYFKVYIPKSDMVEGNILVLNKDSILKVDYDLFSIWDWSDENNQVSGDIEILEVNRRSVKVRMHFLIDDIRRDSQLKVNGIRVFEK